MRTCTACGQTKPRTDFFADRRKKHGLQARCKVCKMAATREYMRRTDGDKRRYWANPERERERHLIRKYGIDQAGYDALFVRQNGRCAICQKTQERAFDVDHDHSTSRVRGLLCTNCNRMVGHAGDSAARLEAAANYLRAITPQAAAEVVAAVMECRP